MFKKGYKQTEEHKRKIRESNRGAAISVALRGRKKPWMNGDKNPAKKLENRLKISQGLRGKTFSNARKKVLSEAQIKSQKGRRGNAWKHGKSRDKYGHNFPEVLKWRSSVFERDNWTCQTCGVRGIYLESHHIKSWAKYPKLRFSVDNGVTLCKHCHSLTDNYKGRAVTCV